MDAVVTERLGRCYVCACPHDMHLHHTRDSDQRCGRCGPRSCPEYVDPRARWPRLSRDQRYTRTATQQRFRDNVIALQQYQLELERSRRLPIPVQRPPSEPMPEPPRYRPQRFTAAYREVAKRAQRRPR